MKTMIRVLAFAVGCLAGALAVLISNQPTPAVEMRAASVTPAMASTADLSGVAWEGTSLVTSTLAALDESVKIDVATGSLVVVTLWGDFDATVNFEASLGGAVWHPFGCFAGNGTKKADVRVYSVVKGGEWTCHAGGMAFRVKPSRYTSGAVRVTLTVVETKADPPAKDARPIAAAPKTPEQAPVKITDATLAPQAMLSAGYTVDRNVVTIRVDELGRVICAPEEPLPDTCAYVWVDENDVILEKPRLECRP